MAATPNNRQRQQPNNPSENDDVGDISQYIKKADYDPIIDGINKRLDALEKRVKDKPAIVATLKEVLEKDRNIDPIMLKYIEDHVDLKPMVKNVADSFDGRLVKAFMKKGGYAIIALLYTLALIAATAWITKQVDGHTVDVHTDTSSSHGKNG